jgi:hypothetical protein
MRPGDLIPIKTLDESQYSTSGNCSMKLIHRHRRLQVKNQARLPSASASITQHARIATTASDLHVGSWLLPIKILLYFS